MPRRFCNASVIPPTAHVGPLSHSLAADPTACDFFFLQHPEYTAAESGARKPAMIDRL